MLRCPRCARRFADNSRVLNHMNQPLSSCLSYHNEITAHANANALSLSNSSPADIHSTGSDNFFSSFIGPNSHSTTRQSLSDNALNATMDLDSVTVDQHGAPDATMDTTPIDGPSSTSPFFETYPGAAQTFGHATTFMDLFDTDPHSDKRRDHPYYPFASRGEWQLASFLLCSDLSLNAVDKFLKLELVSNFKS